MCGLCGIFGVADHWTDGAGLDADRGSASRRADRQHRVRIANAVLGLFGLRLSEWMSRLTLTSRTGRTEIVDHLGAVWPAAERVAGRALDPLDPAFIARVEQLRPD
jgi:hypothetical protein